MDHFNKGVRNTAQKRTTNPNTKPRARNRKNSSTAPPAQPSARTVRQWYNQNKPQFQNYANTSSTNVNDAITLLRDVTKTGTKTNKINAKMLK